MAKNIPPVIKKYQLGREVWYFLSAAIIVTIVLEIIWPNIVLVYFNLNILFILWFVSGIFLLFKK